MSVGVQNTSLCPHRLSRFSHIALHQGRVLRLRRVRLHNDAADGALRRRKHKTERMVARARTRASLAPNGPEKLSDLPLPHLPAVSGHGLTDSKRTKLLGIQTLGARKKQMCQITTFAERALFTSLSTSSENRSNDLWKLPEATKSCPKCSTSCANRQKLRGCYRRSCSILYNLPRKVKRAGRQLLPRINSLQIGQNFTNQSTANAVLAELIAKDRNFLAYQIAEVYAWRGETDNAFEWLQIFVDNHDTGLLSLLIDPLNAQFKARLPVQCAARQSWFAARIRG